MNKSFRLLTTVLLTAALATGGTVAAEAAPRQNPSTNCVQANPAYLQYYTRDIPTQVPCGYWDTEMGRQLGNDRTQVWSLLNNNYWGNQNLVKNIMIRDFVAVTASMSRITGVRAVLGDYIADIANRTITQRYALSVFATLQYHAQYTFDTRKHWDDMYRAFKIAKEANSRLNKTWTKPVLNAYLTLVVSSKQLAYFVQDETLSFALSQRWRQLQG